MIWRIICQTFYRPIALLLPTNFHKTFPTNFHKTFSKTIPGLFPRGFSKSFPNTFSETFPDHTLRTFPKPFSEIVSQLFSKTKSIFPQIEKKNRPPPTLNRFKLGRGIYIKKKTPKVGIN